MKNMTLGLFALTLAVAAGPVMASQTCQGNLNVIGHPEWSGYYVTTLTPTYGTVSLTNGWGTQSFHLPICSYQTMGGGCKEATYPAYSLGMGDTPGMSVGIETGAGYVRVGVLGMQSCRLF